MNIKTQSAICVHYIRLDIGTFSAGRIWDRRIWIKFCVLNGVFFTDEHNVKQKDQLVKWKEIKLVRRFIEAQPQRMTERVMWIVDCKKSESVIYLDWIVLYTLFVIFQRATCLMLGMISEIIHDAFKCYAWKLMKSSVHSIPTRMISTNENISKCLTIITLTSHNFNDLQSRTFEEIWVSRVAEKVLNILISFFMFCYQSLAYCKQLQQQ